LRPRDRRCVSNAESPGREVRRRLSDTAAGECGGVD